MSVHTLLCLACSSSLPPKSSHPIFTTPCCNRPICPPCITANPRLARYDPCLACPGGVAAVGSGKAKSATVVQKAREPAPRNLDGAVRDEDTFVLGDDEDLEGEDEVPAYSLDPAQQSVATGSADSDDPSAESAPPKYYPPAAQSQAHSNDSAPSVASSSRPSEDPASAESLPSPAPSPPPKYYIKRDDTLRGISLRFGIDGRELCQLNNLPQSTMTTTPHLLHTRGFLTLPPAAQSKLQASDSGPSTDEERAREVRRTRERAEKTLTKEVDARRVEAPIDEESEDGPQSSSRLGFPVDSDIAQAYADPAPSAASPPSKYYIKRNDTLQGIALRFGLDGRELCRLNGLPPSTLSTTPHLLHTRGFLTLPPAVQSKLQASDARPSTDEERAREARRARERAEKRLQTLTKEVDWRVAKAYIALADDADEADAFALKQKELGAPLSSAGSGSSSRLEALAVDRYLDDLEWEADQLRAGRSVHIPPLPLHGGQAQLSTKA